MKSIVQEFIITEDFHLAASDGTPLEKNSDPRFVLAVRLGQILGRIENED